MSDVLSEVLGNPIVGVVAGALGIAWVSLWLAAAWWAYGDAAQRSGSSVPPLGAAAWIVLSTPLLLPLSITIYRTMRPQVTAAETREQDLMLQLNHAAAFGASTCDACGVQIDAGWQRCPACATWLSASCEHCGRSSSVQLETCPFCGSEEQKRAPFVVPGHGKAAASEGLAAAADDSAPQDRRNASSARPASYATSRDALSASS